MTECHLLQELLSNAKKLQEYMNYSQAHTGGSQAVSVVLPPKLPPQVFQQLCAFPDTMKANDSSQSYLPFEVYGKSKCKIPTFHAL